MTFRTIHATYGLTDMAQAQAAGVPINFPPVMVGADNA